MNKKINVTCEKCKESFIFTSESSVVDKVLDEEHYICFTCEDKLELQNIIYREEIARMQKSLRKKNKSIKDLNESVKNIKSERDEWKVDANQLDKEKDEFIIENEKLKSQLQQQALPVVPEDVAKLPPFDDMKEYVLDDRLLTIREYLNKLDDKSNSDITEAEAWCMIHEDIVYRAMLNGYTVEKTQLFYLKHIDMSKSDAHLNWYLAKGTDNVLIHQGIKKGKSPKLKCILKLTQQEIDSMQTGSYELVPVEDGE